ncbi:MAG TPA: ABC transporter permease, partial [Acidobacteriota bacterium]|nr:ABC transporter permease [Acidobacteriota bacterium]
MWLRLIFHSFQRDAQKKAVAIAAVALATCLATFLLNWSLNLGDNLQRDLRAYGANIIITPEGDSLPVISGSLELGSMNWDRYLRFSDLQRLREIFWTNQILAYAPLLPQSVRFQDQALTLIGTEFGRTNAVMSLPKTSPYLSLEGSWPNARDEAAAGYALVQKFGWKIGRKIRVMDQDRATDFTITGIVRSGGGEDHQLFANLNAVQQLTNHPDAIRQLLVSAMVTPENLLFYKYHRSPASLTPKEWERYSCTPYITSVATDITKVMAGSEARVVRQISKTEEKIVKKVNWLMVLVMLAGLVAAALAMTSTTTGMILERRKELALMKAIGS